MAMGMTRAHRPPMVATMRIALLCLVLTAGCASAPAAAPEQNAAAAGGAAGCLAQGFVAAADSGRGEMIVVGLVLMPLCALLASAHPESVANGAFVPRPLGMYGRGSKGSGGLVSRK